MGGGLEFVHPLDEMAHPYKPLFFDVPIPGALAKCALFPVGQDEGTAETIWVPHRTAPSPRAVGDRFDGILVVRARVRFRFDSSVAPSDEWNTVADNFWNQMYDDEQREQVRFALTGGSQLSHIGVVILPLCEVGRGPFTSDDFEMKISSSAPPPPNPFDAATVPSTVDMDLTHFNVFTVLRAILGSSVSTGSPLKADTSPLTTADFTKVAALVDTQLGDSAGTRSVVAL
jgi:hypothetical protein